MAIDPKGNTMYVWLGLPAILKINIATGYVSIYAGTYSSGKANSNVPANLSPVNGPGSLTVDATGNVYYTSPIPNQVYVINSATYRISLFAGVAYTQSPGIFLGDGSQAKKAYLELWPSSGMAYSSSTNALYIADSNNYRVRKVALTTGIITTFAGNGVTGCQGDGSQATAAQLYFPGGLAADTAGNIYISDWSQSLIRKVNSGGIIFTVAGINPGRLKSPNT